MKKGAKRAWIVVDKILGKDEVLMRREDGNWLLRENAQVLRFYYENMGADGQEAT